MSLPATTTGPRRMLRSGFQQPFDRRGRLLGLFFGQEVAAWHRQGAEVRRPGGPDALRVEGQRGLAGILPGGQNGHAQPASGVSVAFVAVAVDEGAGAVVVADRVDRLGPARGGQIVITDLGRDRARLLDPGVKECQKKVSGSAATNRSGRLLGWASRYRWNALYLAGLVIAIVVVPLLVGPGWLVAAAPEGGIRATAGAVVTYGYWPTVVLLCLAALTALYRFALPYTPVARQPARRRRGHRHLADRQVPAPPLPTARVHPQRRLRRHRQDHRRPALPLCHRPGDPARRRTERHTRPHDEPDRRGH